MARGGTLRGWKEISAYLGVSERTAKRWEQSRRIPVHRVPGAARDAVFAHSEELDKWRCPSVVADATPVQAPGTSRDLGARGVGIQWKRALRRVSLVLVAAASVAGALGWLESRHVESVFATPERPVVLRITHRGGQALVGLPDGECGEAVLDGAPPLLLCARVAGESLWVDVLQRNAGSAEAGATTKTSLRLDPNAEVRVTRPLRFDVEWIAASGKPSRP